MKATYNTYFGWKYCKQKELAMSRKKSYWDFFLSIVIAFFIILLISHLLAKLDSIIKLTSINPFGISIANAASSHSISDGDLIKCSGSTAVYLVKDNNRYSFPFKKVYEAYYGNDFSKVKTVSLATLSSLSLKGNVKLPENTLVKIATDPKVYKVVSINNSKYLEWIKTEAEAKSQFGSNWAKSIIDIPDVFFVDYQTVTVQASQPINTSKPAGLIEICMSIKPSEQITPAQKMLLEQCEKMGAKVTDEGVAFVNEPMIPQSVTYNNEPIEQDTTPTNSGNNSNSDSNNSSNTSPTPTNNNSTNPESNTINPAYGPLIRVGLFSSTETQTIKANTSFKIKDANGAVLASVPLNALATASFNFTNKTYSFAANGTSISTSSYLRFVGDSNNTVFEIVNLEWRPAWNTSLNDNKFLGVLELRYSPTTNKLWMINELQLEYYLKGLAETSNSSPMEYQKALITAARTYAMYHYNRGTKHAAEYYTLDATYDQVYKGYNSQLRLPKVSEAVEATKGQVVTYQGNVVVTPYFSHSDGYTRNYEDVWGGKIVPWCRSVKEPNGYTKTTLYGHGVGLSAYGAILLANDYNYNFEQILKYYYTGIELKKIY
ncbi:SpoIID/LytB domain-containing protein [Candidatus Falkowbacteria bacterium]|nr:SpoIID/LytB domain-containing protein [Candidatus Falkowbacteria bacterium]